MFENYTILSLDKDEVYVRNDRQNQLKKVDAAIFDCDGVLIDVRESYNRAISMTVAFILESLIGQSIQ